MSSTGELFKLDLDWYSDATPTAIAASRDTATQPELRPWGEAEIYATLRELNDYLYAMSTCCNRFDLQIAHMPLRVLLQEYLLRFPASQYAPLARWRLAQADALLDDHSSDTWMLQAIQQALVDGHASVDDLDAFLQPYGFVVANQQQAPNLFDDGQTATVFQVNIPSFQAFDGMIFAVRQDQKAQYHLEPIYLDWNFNFGSDGIVGIADKTGNGIPEVVVLAGRHSGTMCNLALHIFEWQKDRFTELTRGDILLSECISEWSYSDPDANGIQTITLKNFFLSGMRPLPGMGRLMNAFRLNWTMTLRLLTS